MIAKAGKPMVKVTAVEPSPEPRRLGFLAGQIQVPDDFDQMGQEEMDRQFSGSG